MGARLGKCLRATFFRESGAGSCLLYILCSHELEPLPSWLAHLQVNKGMVLNDKSQVISCSRDCLLQLTAGEGRASQVQDG